tara:strand:- start:422 stop:574 length:153 start_codon:yes stop_codon:yes gene_type:complete
MAAVPDDTSGTKLIAAGVDKPSVDRPAVGVLSSEVPQLLIKNITANEEIR